MIIFEKKNGAICCRLEASNDDLLELSDTMYINPTVAGVLTVILMESGRRERFICDVKASIVNKPVIVFSVRLVTYRPTLQLTLMRFKRAMIVILRALP
jgi:hypothetical protein